MSAFVFRLDSVLRVRLHAEQKQQRAVADAQLKLKQLQSNLASCEQRIGEARLELKRHVGTGRLDPRWLLMHAHHTQDLRVRAAALSDEVFQAGLVLESAREAFVVASAKRKSLEKLRERQREQFELSQSRLDRLTHDEIASRTRP